MKVGANKHLSPQDFLEAARTARQSAPGPDGIPFAAWVAAGTVDARATAEVESIVRRCIRMPLEFNPTTWIFILETFEELAARGQVRSGETRLLTLKTTGS